MEERDDSLMLYRKKKKDCGQQICNLSTLCVYVHAEFKSLEILFKVEKYLLMVPINPNE